jgi:hypothetical protein
MSQFRPEKPEKDKTIRIEILVKSGTLLDHFWTTFQTSIALLPDAEFFSEWSVIRCSLHIHTSE